MPTSEGLVPGTAVPMEALRALPIASPQEWSDGPSLVVFASGGCAPCRELVEKLNVDVRRIRDWRMLFVESEHQGSGNESLKTVANFEAIWATDRSGKFREAFKTRATPSSYLLHEGRVVAHRLGSNVGDLLQLYESAFSAGHPRIAVAANQP